MLTLKKFQTVMFSAVIFSAVIMGMCIPSVYAEGEAQPEEAPLSREFLNYKPSANSQGTNPEILGGTPDPSEYPGGYIPSPVDRSHLADNTPNKTSSIGYVGNTVIPAKYDLRDVDGTSYLPAVRNQGSYATCWAHAALGGVESNYLRQGLSFLSEVDLSELHMAWFVYEDPKEGHSFAIRTGSFSGGPVLGLGGNADQAIAFMSRFAGPTLESNLPYTSASNTVEGMQAVVGDKHPESYDLNIRLHDAYTLGSMTDSLRDTVKELIMENGAVQISYYSQQTVAGQGTSSYYYKTSEDCYSYFCSTDTTPNHAVMIVGWDDNFSRKNFNPSVTSPDIDGAWLIRNSWGTDTGTEYNGYFWMSYQQKMTGVTAYVGGKVTDGMTAYYHDALGECSTFGYSSDGARIPGWAANVFKAEGKNEVLSEISLVTTENNADYAVYVFRLGTEKPSSFAVSAEKAVTKKTGTMTYAGYHVVELDDTVALDEGEYFAVVVNTTNTGAYNIAIERSANYSDGSAYSVAVVNEGESYFSSGSSFPSSWEDGSTFSSQRNACIKAFTITKSEGESETITVDSTTFPDEKFRSYVTTNYGTTPTLSELAAVTSLDLANLGITDLTGLTYFTGLTALDISGNTGLSTIDITGLSIKPEDITCDTTTNIINGGGDVLPSLGNHSLVLSDGLLGVDFYITIPAGVVSDGAYMDFTVNGTTGNPSMLSSATLTGENENEYRFTAYINSIQMAEKITATFHYGENQAYTVSQNYSASDYCDSALTQFTGEENEKLTATVKAIKDYGHYVQIPLADYHGWTIGTDYAEMEAANVYTDATSEDVKTAVSNYQIDKGDYENAGLGYVMFDLELNSSTKLTLYLSPSSTAENFPENMRVEVDGGSAYVPAKENGVFVVEIDNICAQDLDKTHTVHVHALQEFDINVSAFSYVYEALNTNPETNKGLKYAVTSLYKYCIATQEYRESQGLSN